MRQARYLQSLYEDDYFQKKKEMQTSEEVGSEPGSEGIESLEDAASVMENADKTPTVATRRVAEVITIPDNDYEDAFTQPAPKNTLHENRNQNNVGTEDFIKIRTSALKEPTVRDPPCARCKNVKTCHNQVTGAKRKMKVACLECMVDHTACPDSVARRLTKAGAGVDDQTVRKRAQATMRANNMQTQRVINKGLMVTVVEKGVKLAHKKGKAASGSKTGPVLNDSKDTSEADKKIQKGLELQQSFTFVRHNLPSDSTAAILDEFEEVVAETKELFSIYDDLFDRLMQNRDRWEGGEHGNGCRCRRRGRGDGRRGVGPCDLRA